MKCLRNVCLTLAALSVLDGLSAQTPSVSNLSTRAQVGSSSDIIISGFNIGPGGNKTVLIRATGPALAGFGVTGAHTDPKLELFSGATKINENDNWSSGDAATFGAVGAFALTPGSRDAALVATLPPGSYTAQVTGVGTATGIALIEVYEVGAEISRLTNISSRAQVGTGANILIPGLVISPGTGTRRLLIRAAGPALGALGVTGTLVDPTVTVMNGANVAVATNDNWGTPTGNGAADATLLSSAFTEAGAFAFAASSRDAALITDFAPGSYTIQVSGVGETSGVALVEVYDVTPNVAPATVTLTATRGSANEAGTQAGEFRFVRDGSTTSPLTVNYGISGSATNGIDYPALFGSITIPSGATSATLSLQPLADTTVEPAETVTLTLGSGSNYTLGSQTSGTVSIADSPGTLYVATLRPAGGATGSAGSGLATIVLSASGTIATVNVSFSNLSSGQVGGHLFLGNSTSAGDYVMNLPLGQVNGAQWNIGPTATYTSTQIIDALKNGLIYVGLDSAQFPAGELRGAFLSAIGSQTFTAPSAPPPVSLNNLSANEAARLLLQGTFGPKQSEIDALTGNSVNSWITAQLALPNSSHRARTLKELQDIPIPNSNDPNTPTPAHRQYAWFYNVLQGPDQLRQRVAFALSQILVVSDATLAGQAFAEPLAHYYDILATNAFGNYRTLLEQVTLSPVMGTYLSHLRNAKADPAAGTNPDENYAREVMQLFTIGLVQLQPDGTLKLDSQGLPIPTYSQSTITEMAKVLTGWAYHSTLPNPNFRRGTPNRIDPMMLYPAFHENSAKTIVNGIVIPANLGGTEDLRRALDALYNHDNTAPFISKQLIQRLVTANPSPAYVYRVAQVFTQEKASSNQLGAVVRAILTDYEARSPAVADDPGYGKLREPLLRLTAILRSFNATSASGHYVTNFGNTDPALGQAPLRSPSVFNFFEPGYVYPGPLAAAGLVAPEFQITNDTTAISTANFYRDTIFRNAGTGVNAPNIAVLDLSAETALVSNVPALIDRLDRLMTAGQLSAASRARITTALNAVPANTPAQILDRARTAVLLIATSPEGATQR